MHVPPSTSLSKIKMASISISMLVSAAPAITATTQISKPKNPEDMPIHPFQIFFIVVLLIPIPISGFGSPGPIAAAFGDSGFFCAIGAGGKQEVVCWDKNNKSSSSSSETYLGSLPPMATLSGGDGFVCGVTSNYSQPYCWNLVDSGADLVPESFRYVSYSKIASGSDHVCAIRGNYYSGVDYGTVDCWVFRRGGSNSNFTMSVVYDSSFRNSSIDGVLFRGVVSGDGFSCGVVNDGGVICWGPKSAELGVFDVDGGFENLASGRGSVCGVLSVSGEVKCWGNGDEYGSPPAGTPFVSLSAGARHYCGVRGDDHGVQCWGSVEASLVPKGSGFLAIASTDFTTCGVREVDLVLDCWGVHGQSSSDYSPPLQLCSPGVCSPGSCVAGKFAFNASILNELELTSLCARKELRICLACGSNCSQGYFASSACTGDADRICTACSLCQNSSCWDVCGLSSASWTRHLDPREVKKIVIIIGSSVLGSMVILLGWCLIPRMTKAKDDEERSKSGCFFCAGKPVVEADPDPNPPLALSTSASLGTTQIFRLSELKDATHGFKEFSELGRGSFGFVYKAVLSDGRQVAVKRANAATIIHTNTREFEAELEILCNMRHGNIVNLLGYCAEMGERLLVYEFMPHGTLHDHLHGDLSPLDWHLRLKIALQAARGLEYLHREAAPPVVHRDVKTSNILLDSEWCARIADFGLLSANDRDLNSDMEGDVYNFGIVLLEILSGRKAHDADCTPPSIAEWAVPLIRRGKAAAIIDRNVALLRNVEPLLKLADLAELALRENPRERPGMCEVASSLDQIVKGGLIL